MSTSQANSLHHPLNAISSAYPPRPTLPAAVEGSHFPSSPCKSEEKEEDLQIEPQVGGAEAKAEAEEEEEEEEEGVEEKPKLFKRPTLLFNLPSRYATSFCDFNPEYSPHPDPHPPPLYLPSESDISPNHYTIPLSRKRCLIRALTSSISNSNNSSGSATTVTKHAVGSKRSYPSSSNANTTTNSSYIPLEKKQKWNHMDHLTRRECLRVALAASRLTDQNDVEDPSVRLQIAQTVHSWSVVQLKEYMNRAGFRIGGMARHQMATLVHLHISPEQPGQSQRQQQNQSSSIGTP